MKRLALLIFGLLLSVIAPSGQAVAHPQDMGSLRISVRPLGADLKLEFPPGSSKPTLQNPFELVGAGRCTWTGYHAACEGQPRALILKFLEQTPPGFEVVVTTVRADGSTSEQVASAARERIEFSSSAPQSWGQFIGMGIRHIGAVPSEWMGARGFHLPDGIDHILFVVALVLGGGGIWNILRTVTGFTLGHSITLALATMGVVQFPSRLVESAIALSIAYVAGEALLKRSGRQWRVACLFGLVHGLGFASALAELQLSGENLLKALIGFNVGVEVGQAVIVALTIPILTALQQSKTTARFAVPACSLGIFAAGGFWFVERAFG